MEILVVEDEAGIADFLERGLRAEGYGVRLAGDGEGGARLALDPEVDLVVLDRGATDYVTKPFAFDELLARIRARLRDGDAGSETVLEAAGIKLDLLTREATREGEATRLPEREAELLAYLMRHAGRVCTRDDLLTAVWGYEHDPGTNIVQVYIGYLRRKLARPDSPAPIETLRAVGYRLRERG